MLFQKHILLLDGCTSQCLEYLKQMKQAGCETTVLCNSRLDVCYASRYPDHKILGISCPDDPPGTEASILRLARSGHYDLVIPFTEYSAAILAHHKQELQHSLSVAVNDPAVFDFAQDKQNIMKLCAEHGIPCPRTIFSAHSMAEILDSGISFPLVLKPSHGYGARGFHRVDSPTALAQLLSEKQIDLSETVIQECLPADSLCVSENLFIDRNGTIQSAFLYKSVRHYPLDGGSGVLNITFDDPQIHQTCACLAGLLNLKGAVGVDLMIDSRSGIAKVLEVNLRPIACAKAGFLAGINQAHQLLEDTFLHRVTPIRAYRSDVRIRRSQIDVLWFLKSPDRFHTSPSWFSWKHTYDQLFSWRDPLPWFAFSLHGVLNYKKEMAERS